MEWDKSKNTYTDEQLKEILAQHKLWLDTNFEEGKRADLSDSILVGVNFQGVNLLGANLRRANFQETNFQDANLREVDLWGASLQGANLWGVNLQFANLRKADLRVADLRVADLQGANLRFAKLQGADLQGANLQGADLQGAKLQETNFKGVRIEGTMLEYLPNNQKEIQEKENQINQLEQELQQATQSGEQTEEQLQQLSDELNQARQEKNDLVNQWREERECKEREWQEKLKTKLNEDIQNAQLALANSLESADIRIKEHSSMAKWIGWGAIVFIILDLGAIIYLWFHHQEFIALFKDVGAWALTLYNIPILLVFSIAITLFRHQKKHLDEVRHYSAEKRQIELYSGLLKASQYAAASLNNSQESAEYVKETFTAIRNRILSEQPHNNTAASASEKEDYDQTSFLKTCVDITNKAVDIISKNSEKK